MLRRSSCVTQQHSSPITAASTKDDVQRAIARCQHSGRKSEAAVCKAYLQDRAVLPSEQPGVRVLLADVRVGRVHGRHRAAVDLLPGSAVKHLRVDRPHHVRRVQKTLKPGRQLIRKGAGCKPDTEPCTEHHHERCFIQRLRLERSAVHPADKTLHTSPFFLPTPPLQEPPMTKTLPSDMVAVAWASAAASQRAVVEQEACRRILPKERLCGRQAPGHQAWPETRCCRGTLKCLEGTGLTGDDSSTPSYGILTVRSYDIRQHLVAPAEVHLRPLAPGHGGRGEPARAGVRVAAGDDDAPVRHRGHACRTH